MAITLRIKNTGSETLTLAPDETVDVEVVSGEAPPPSGTLSAALTAWASAAPANKPVGGPFAFVADQWGSGGSPSGRTYIDLTPKHLIRQHCYVTSFQYKPATVSTGGWMLEIRRSNGSGGYSIVGQSQTFQPSGTGVQTLTLTTTIGPCQPGDYPAVFVPFGNSISVSADGLADSAYVSGNPSVITSPSSFEGYYPDIMPRGQAPFLVTVGDSIICAHGEVLFRPFRDGGTLGDPDGEPASVMRGAFPGLTFQNFARGGETWAHGAAIAANIATAATRAVVFHYGVNDIFNNRTWSAISADMAACKAALPSGTVMFVNEVLPCTAFNDTQAAAIRTLNANYATWCTANGAFLISCHDAMGQTRSSTGQLDDLKADYDQDGTHLNLAGVAAFSAVIADALDAHDWDA